MPEERKITDRDLQSGKSYAASRNILKDDIAILLSEMRSIEGKIQKARFTDTGAVVGLVSQLLEVSYGLYTQTVEQLKEGHVELIEKKSGTEDPEEETDSILNFFDDPWVMQETEEEYKILPGKTAKRALKFVRKYREYLKEAGLTDMKTYETRPGYAYRESM